METASTKEQDFRFETVSKKARNDLETEIETETSKNLSRDVSRPRQCLETLAALKIGHFWGIRQTGDEILPLESLGEWTTETFATVLFTIGQLCFRVHSGNIAV